MRRTKGWLCTSLLLVFLGGTTLEGQSNWPTPPDGWWENLAAGTSATYEINMTGMNVNMTQTVSGVEGTMITLETAVSMMGAAMPGSSSTIDAMTLTPEASLAMLSSMGGGASAPEMQANLDAMVQIEGEEACTIGDLELMCTVYVTETPNSTVRTWHSTSIPPVFAGGAVKAEISAQGLSYGVTMIAYEGDLMEN